MWINIIKSQNEAKIVKTCIAQEFMRRLKKNYKISKLVSILQETLDSVKSIQKGLAFIRIKKTDTESRYRAPLVKRSVIIKVTKK